jgi:hypothetical protein
MGVKLQDDDEATFLLGLNISKTAKIAKTRLSQHSYLLRKIVFSACEGQMFGGWSRGRRRELLHIAVTSADVDVWKSGEPGKLAK